MSVVEVVFDFCAHGAGRRMRFAIVAVVVGVSCLGGLWYRGYHLGQFSFQEILDSEGVAEQAATCVQGHVVCVERDLVVCDPECPLPSDWFYGGFWSDFNSRV